MWRGFSGWWLNLRWTAGGEEGLGGTLVIWGDMSGGWVVIKGVGSDGGLV